MPLWYAFGFMPLQDTVCKALLIDVASNSCQRVKELSTRFGPGFWCENSGLFFLALEKGFSLFFYEFEESLNGVLRRLGRRKIIKNYSNKRDAFVYENFTLMQYAVYKEDMNALKVILRCWVHNLNRVSGENCYCYVSFRYDCSCSCSIAMFAFVVIGLFILLLIYSFFLYSSPSSHPLSSFPPFSSTLFYFI